MIVAHWQAANVHRWSWRRPAVALGASLLLHGLLAGNWPSGGRPAVGVMPQLQAQLEIPLEAAAPVATVAEPFREAEAPRPSRSVVAATPLAARQAASVAAAEIQPSTSAGVNAGSNIPDSGFIPARELDRFPAPVIPLDFGGAGIGAGTVRAWVSIDLAGTVVDVTVLDADPSGALQRQLREYLRTVQFLPGIKDERPVRSRILLELTGRS